MPITREQLEEEYQSKEVNDSGNVGESVHEAMRLVRNPGKAVSEMAKGSYQNNIGNGITVKENEIGFNADEVTDYLIARLSEAEEDNPESYNSVESARRALAKEYDADNEYREAISRAISGKLENSDLLDTYVEKDIGTHVYVPDDEV